jgi:metal-responsive CopG/Arc/MetJ family transcriptional regulator
MSQSKKERCIEIIQEQAAHIIYENRAYLNDENIRRLNVIEMNMENIKEQIKKIRRLEGYDLEEGY